MIKDLEETLASQEYPERMAKQGIPGSQGLKAIQA